MSKPLPPTTARKRTLDARARAAGWSNHSQFETATIDGRMYYPQRPVDFESAAESERRQRDWERGSKIKTAMEAIGYPVQSVTVTEIIKALYSLGIRIDRVRPNADAPRFRETARKLAEVLGIERN